MAEEVFRVRFTQDGAKEIVRSFDDFIRGADTAEEAAARLVKATNEVRRSADPTQKAYDRLAGSMHTLARAEQAGIVSAGERIRLQQRMTITAQGSLRPIGTLISKIGEETRAWGLSNTARQASIRTISQVEALMRRGIAVTEQEKSAILSANTAYFQKRDGLRAVAEAQDMAATAARKAAAEQVAAANRIERENDQLLASYQQIYRNSGTAVESATSKMEQSHDQLREAQRRGIISSQQLSEAERRLNTQYREGIDPLEKVGRLQIERIGYLRGLANGGRQLAQVERDLTRLTAQGVRLDGQRVASLRRLTAQADRLERAYGTLNRAGTVFGNVIGGVGIGLAAGFFTRSLDSVTQFGNRLRLVASDQSNANALFGEVAQIANNTRSDLESVVGAYSRIARATKDVGLSQRDALRITEAVTQSFKISGAGIQEASAAAIQFGQALSSNRLGGEELRSILEQAPRLSQAIVDGINLLNTTDPSTLPKKLRDEIAKTGRVSIGTLRDLAKQGLLTTDVVSRAVLSQQQAVSSEFKRTVPTIGEAITILNNNWLIFLNDFNKGTGIARIIAGGIMLIANNMSTVIPIALAFGSILAATFVMSGLINFINVLRSLPLMFGLSTAATLTNTGATAGATTAVAANARALAAETAALGLNSAAQSANAGSRTAGATGRVVQGGGAAVNAVAATMAATGAAAAAAAPKVSMVTAAMTGLAGAAWVVLGIVSAIAIGMGVFVGATVAALGVAIGLWTMLRDKTKDADKQLLIYGEGTTQKAIEGNINFMDTVLGVWDAIGGKTDEITLSQQQANRQVAEAGITDAKELTEFQLAAQQEVLNGAAISAAETQSVFSSMSDGIAKDLITLVGGFVQGSVFISESFRTMGLVVAATVTNLVTGIARQIADLFNNTVVPIMNAAKSVGIGGGASNVGANIRGPIDVGAVAAPSNNQAGARALEAGANFRERAARFASSGAARREGAGRPGLNAGGLNTLGQGAENGSGNSGNSGAGRAAEAAAKRLEGAYRSLRDELNPLLKITEDYATDQETLNKAQTAGLITGEQHADLVGRLTRRYEDARDPLGKYIRDTEAEIGVLGLAANQRELATAIMSKEREERDRLRRELLPEEQARITEIETRKQVTQQVTAMTDAIKDAVTARTLELGMLGRTPQQIEAETMARATLSQAIKDGTEGVEQALAAETALNLSFIQTRDAGRRVDEMYQELTASQRTFTQNSAALSTLYDTNRISLERYNRELRSLALAANSVETSERAGLERSILNLKARTEDAASTVAGAFDNAFKSIEDGFAGLFAGQEFNAQQFFANIASDAARVFYQQAIDPLVSNLGASLNIPGFASGAGDAAAAAATQQQIEAAKTAVAMQGEQTRAALAAATAPAAISTAAAAQAGVEGAKTAATATGVTARTGLETGVVGILAGVKGAEVATHAGGEVAKTGATVAGTTARVGAEGAATAATSGFNLISTIQTVGMNAVKAATGAYAAIASIPIVGPVLAPVAAAAALAGVYAIGKSVFSAADGFGSVPYDGAMTELHKEEMVLPAKYANPLRDQLTSGGGAQAPSQVNVPIKVINVNDPNDAVAAMDSAGGERVILNVIRNNPSTVAALLKG